MAEILITKDIKIYFEYDGKTFLIPVNPDKIEITQKGNNKTFDIVQLGEINTLRGLSLKGMKLQSFFPLNKQAPYLVDKGITTTPTQYINFFNDLRALRKAVRVVVSKLNINMVVSIENFTYTHKAGTDDVYYTLELKEYKSYKSKVVKISKPVATRPPVVVIPPAPARPQTGFAVGNTVIVSGRWWYNSYGAAPFGNAPAGFRGKINFTNTKGSHGFHVTDMNGGWKGWVQQSQLQHV